MTNPSIRKPAPRHSHEPTFRHSHEPAFRHSHESGNPVFWVSVISNKLPSIECLDSRLRGNDGGAVSVFSGKYPQAKILLFSQKQKTKNSNLKFVIPARAGIQFFEFQSFPRNYLSIECLDSRLRGMTNPSIRKPAPRHSHEPAPRHSHESGNPVFWVSVISDKLP